MTVTFYELMRAFFPEDMLKAPRWGLVQTNKRPALGMGAPEWHADFETAAKNHAGGGGANNINRHGLGYCFGGVSSKTTPAEDGDHDNLTAEEAEQQKKPVGALYIKPDPRYGCIDYDHVLDKTTHELIDVLSPKLVGEIRVMTAAYPTEISLSGAGLHVIFEKPAGWPSFTKNKTGIREIFSGAGYVIFTGQRWKHAAYYRLTSPDGGPEAAVELQACKTRAKAMLLDIVSKRNAPQRLTMPENNQHDKTAEQDPITTEDIMQIAAWRKAEADKVTLYMQRENIGTTEAEAMLSIMTRIAMDAAEAAYKSHIPYEAYATPQNIKTLWENSEEYKVSYASCICDYNESKISLTVGKAIDAGRNKYKGLCNWVITTDRGKTVAKKAGSQAEEAPPEPEYTEEEAAEARKIYEAGEMLEILLKSCHDDHVGDDTIIRAMLLSAAAINVTNSKGIHICITGEKGTGKSHAARTVCNHIPQSRVIYGGLSDMALYYHKFPAGSIIVMDDEDLSDNLRNVLKQATMDWDKSAEHRTVINHNEATMRAPLRTPWWTLKVEKPGDDQVLDRQLVMWTDDGPEQRDAIIRATRELVINPETPQRSYGTYRALWGYLPATTVVIPYAANIGISPSINPRNINLFMDLIMAHALLHAPKRTRDKHEWIEASKADFKAAQDIMNPLLESKGGSQGLKLNPSEERVLNFLRGKPSGKILYGDILSGMQISDAYLSRALYGRNDGNHHSAGLTTLCPVIHVIPVTDDEKGGRRCGRKAVVWNKAAVEAWIAAGTSGFYWIDSPDPPTGQPPTHEAESGLHSFPRREIRPASS